MTEEAAITHALRWLCQQARVRGAIDVEASQEPFGSWLVVLNCAASQPPELGRWRLRIYPSGVVRQLPPTEDHREA